MEREIKSRRPYPFFKFYVPQANSDVRLYHHFPIFFLVLVAVILKFIIMNKKTVTAKVNYLINEINVKEKT